MEAVFPVTLACIGESRAGISGRVLGNVCNDPVRRQGEVSFIRMQTTEYQREQAGLADTVGTGDANFLSRVDAKRGIGQQCVAAASYG